MFYIAFLIGVFVGAFLGIIILGLCFMAAEADEQQERMLKEMRKRGR